MLDVPAVTVYTESAWFADDVDATPSVTSVPPDVQRIDGLILPELLNATLQLYCMTSDSAVFSVAFVDDANDSKLLDTLGNAHMRKTENCCF